MGVLLFVRLSLRGLIFGDFWRFEVLRLLIIRITHENSLGVSRIKKEKMKVIALHHCFHCQLPLNLVFSGKRFEIIHLLHWSAQSPIDTNASFYKKIDGRMRRVCYDCFVLLRSPKFTNIMYRERFGTIMVPLRRYVMDWRMIDFWIRSAIHCWHVGL